MLVWVVELIKIDHIFFEASKAVFTGTHDMLAAPIFAPDPISHYIADFRSDVNFVPFR